MVIISLWSFTCTYSTALDSFLPRPSPVSGHPVDGVVTACVFEPFYPRRREPDPERVELARRAQPPPRLDVPAAALRGAPCGPLSGPRARTLRLRAHNQFGVAGLCAEGVVVPVRGGQPPPARSVTLDAEHCVDCHLNVHHPS